jgi:hypothetical protein
VFNQLLLVMNYITNEDVMSVSISGWEVVEEPMSGTLCWYPPNMKNVIIYATPNWETDGVVPFDFYDGSDTYNSLFTLNLNGSIDNQLEQYKFGLLKSIEILTKLN